MTKELWINLPVKDLKKSKEFFTKIGFSFNKKRESEDMAAMMVGGEKVPVMLFVESTFKTSSAQRNGYQTFLGNPVVL